MRFQGGTGSPAECEFAVGQTGERHADHAAHHAFLKTIARFLGHDRFLFHPACAAAFHVGFVEILFRERFLCLEQFEHGLGELCAGGPGFIHAGAGEHVRAAAAFADARVAVADEVRFAAAARFAKRLRAPRAELAAFEVTPEIRVQHPVLEMAVGGAHRGCRTTTARRCRATRRGRDARRRNPKISGSGKPNVCSTVPGLSGVSSGKSTTNFMPTAQSRV